MAGTQRGRPRSSRADEAILEATRDLVASGGYERLSIDAIAARAGVGKQTVYRRWPSKAAVVAEAVLAGYLGLEPQPVPDTGDIDADLRSWLREQTARLAQPSAAALVRGLAGAANDREADAARLYEKLTGPTRRILLHRLSDAVAQAQVRGDADLDTVADTIIATLLYRVLGRHHLSPHADAGRLVDILIAGIGATGGSR